MKKSIAVLFSFFISVSAMAQTQNVEFLRTNFWSFGGDITSNGWKINYTRGSIPDATTRKFLEVEFASIHHPKEYKQTQEFNFAYQGNNPPPPPKPFVYGKQNSFMNLNISYGVYKELGRKADKSGVTVGIKATGGLSLGILKPYYLVLLIPQGDTSLRLENHKYADEYKNLFVDNYSIYGGSGFKTGITELQFVPGAHLKLAMHFDWAAFDEYIKGIEAGISFDAYYKKIPLMVLENNFQFMPAFYCGFEFGKKK